MILRDETTEQKGNPPTGKERGRFRNSESKKVDTESMIDRQSSKGIATWDAN